jgi:CheY-like chemotaxis protein
VRLALSKIKAYVQPRRKRLLVVEDNPAEQISISALLEHNDIEIVSAGTGAAALKMLKDKPADCVVLDLRLPDISGFELLEKLNADPALTDLPVIVFTGRELTAEEERSCIPWRAASSSRAWNRPNGCWMKPPCSCTAMSPICRVRSS